MNILVTGASGNTGSLFLKEWKLKTQDWPHVRCFLEPESDLNYIQDMNSDYYYGDLWNLADVVEATKGIEQIVHIAGIRMTPNILEATRINGIKRLVVVSTTGIYSKFNYLSREYINIENQIINSDLEYTILRPTMIYGNVRDHNMHKLIKFIDKYRVFPLLGRGTNLMQPVYVGDLAAVIAQVLENKHTYKKAYDLPGNVPLSFKDIITTISSYLGKEVRMGYIPMSLALFGGRLYENIASNPVIKYEQILRLTEDKAYSYDEAVKDLDYKPLSFAEGIKLEIDEMRAKGILGG